MIIKQLGSEIVGLVKENKVVVGVGVAIGVGALVYTKRKTIAKKYAEAKAKMDIAKNVVKETLEEEDVIDLEEKEVKTV